jgi:hypothetical protein
MKQSKYKKKNHTALLSILQVEISMLQAQAKHKVLVGVQVGVQKSQLHRTQATNSKDSWSARDRCY